FKDFLSISFHGFSAYKKTLSLQIRQKTLISLPVGWAGAACPCCLSIRWAIFGGPSYDKYIREI
ncbi:MAG: hypothetical protein MJE63_08770, partial [Proteobacteria bacterium]|nr:hypothetical protein [Pseudomonadota bacterium]